MTLPPTTVFAPYPAHSKLLVHRMPTVRDGHNGSPCGFNAAVSCRGWYTAYEFDITCPSCIRHVRGDRT